MSRAWVALAALLLGGCASLNHTSQGHDPLNCESAPIENLRPSRWQRIGANIWLNQGASDALSTPLNRGRISNVVFVVDPSENPARGWLVGSGPDAEAGRALACSVRRDVGHEITDVISPRAQPESVLGVAGLGVVRHWALPEVQAAMGERCERCVKRLEAAVEARRPLVNQVVLPNQLIEGPLLGPFNVMPVQVQPGQAVALLHHRASDVWILPGVIWGYDLVPDLREAKITHLQHILDQLTVLNPKTVVPEQGPAANDTLIERNHRYWQHLLNSLQELWDRGDSQPGAATGLTAAEWDVTGPEGRLRDRLNVQRAWQQFENNSFDADPTIRR